MGDWKTYDGWCDTLAMLHESGSTKKRQILACTLAYLVSLCSGSQASAQLSVKLLSPDAVEDAIRLGLDEKASAKFLQAYVLQSRTGIGTGPSSAISTRRSRGSSSLLRRHAKREETSWLTM